MTFPFRHRLRVRWAEVDAQNVVFNGHYLTYLDTAVTEFWREVGLPYPEAFEQLDGEVFVRRNLLEYHAPARQDDWLDIGLRCDRIGRTSLTFVWEMRAGGRLLVTGETVYVFTSLCTRQPAPVPDSLRHQLSQHAEGQPVYQVVAGPWSAMAEGARVVRTAVFIGEQAIPECEEWDADDDTAHHVVVQSLSGLPVATGRLITAGLPAGQGKIGRMAVIRSSRGIGLGERVLRTLLSEARRQGLTQLSLHAQTSAQAFYARAGFSPVGEVFDEVGIPHITMTLSLTAT